MTEPMPELVQTFRFSIQLTRSLPGRTLAAPPTIRLTGPARISAPPAGSRTGSVGSPAASNAPSALPDELGNGAFQECSGLDLEADVHEYLEGGGNDTTVRRLGRAKHSPVVLKRGMFIPTKGGYVDRSLWNWLDSMVRGVVPLTRYDGHVQVMDARNARVVARWTFVRGLPVKVTGPGLNAKTGEVAVEELHIVHEGLRLETS